MKNKFHIKNIRKAKKAKADSLERKKNAVSEKVE